MSSDTYDDLPAPAPDEPSPDTDRYALLEIGGGETIIYDLENHAAWIQSDGGVELSEMA